MQALTILTQRKALLNRHDVHVPAQRPPDNYKKVVVSWLAYGAREVRKNFAFYTCQLVLKSRFIKKRAFQIANLVFVE
jgi:hypothetical protein